MQNIIMEEVLELGIEEDVLCKLDDHEKKLSDHDTRLNQHGEKLHELEIKNAGYDARFDFIDSEFNTIKISLARIENNSLQSSNILLSTLSQIAINTSSTKNEIEKEDNKSENEIIKGKMDNKTKVILKALGIVAIVITGFFAAKYGVTIPAIM